MAGFFGFFDYTKPGPGVPKDAPPKARIIVFFEVFSRKFWHLVRLNIMFFLFNLPALLAVLFASQFFLQQQLHEDILIDLVLRLVLGATFICIPIITIGPAQAGFTYILRNYSKEEHAFLWWDFKDAAKNNFKQSAIVSLIDFFIVLIIGIDINLYLRMEMNNVFMSIASGVLILFFLIYIMMHLYIYPMMVTFKLSIKQLYKNALIFALMKFFSNLLIIIVVAGLVLLSFMYYSVIGFILFPLITLSLTGLIINFYVYPKLKKYIIDKIEPEAESKSSEDINSDTEFESDEESESDTDLEPDEESELDADLESDEESELDADLESDEDIE